MSNRTKRGRAPAAAKRRSIGPFYLVAGLIAIVLIAALAYAGLQGQQSGTASTAPTPAGPTPEAPTHPTGKTPDGFNYVGSPDAPVVVTEYSDFQ